MTTTPNIALNKPTYRDTRWDVPINANLDILDGLHGKITSKLNTLVTSANLVDVFIYDTRKDSDGGEWVNNALTQSWYTEQLNTATRGSKREFPKVALIVAETTKVSIYDATETGCPMWRVCADYQRPGGGIPTAVAMLNGYMVIAQTVGTYEYNFLSDKRFSRVSTAYYARGEGTGIAGDHVNVTGTVINSTAVIVNNTVHDVTMTTISRTENAFGLLDPVIAVATDGGVSVIDGPAGVGTVVDITWATYTMCARVHFDNANRLWIANDDAIVKARFLHIWDTIPSADLNEATAGTVQGTSSAFYGSTVAGSTLDLAVIGQATSGTYTKAIVEDATGHDAGVTKYSEDTTTPANGMVSYITNSYNTGWLKGDIRRALVCEAEGTTETLTNLVTNGTFDSGAGWVAGTGWAISSGVATKTAGTAANIDQSASIIIGKRYAITFTISGYSAGTIRPYVGIGSGGTSRSANGTYTDILTCSSNTRIYLGADASFAGSIDNVIVTEIIEDRSVKASALTVNGSLTRNPVASGAELQAISGFSASNFLSQAYSADLDFGTGDFYVCGWLKESPNSAIEALFERAYHNGSAYSGSGIFAFLTSAGLLSFRITDDAYATSDTITSTAAVDTSAFTFIVAQKVGSKLELWVNTAKAASDVTITAATGSLSNASATLAVGRSVPSSYPLTNGSIALLRIGVGSLSSAQISKMYQEELAMFQGNAKCTIHGASSAVTALAYDENKELLHVGTSAQITTFAGLTVYNESQAFSGSIKAIAASDDNMLVATTAAAYGYLAEINLRDYLNFLYGLFEKFNIGPRRLGGSLSYCEFEDDGHLKFEGYATTWEDENFDPTTLAGTGTLPTSIAFASTTTTVASFAGNANDEVNGVREYPHKAKLNLPGQTSVKMSFHAHCYPTTAAGGNVRLALEYFFTKEGVAVTTSTTIYVTGAVGTTAWAKKTFTFPDITVPEELGSQFHFRFARLSSDALDTYADALAISTIGFHYEADSTGSRQTLVK